MTRRIKSVCLRVKISDRAEPSEDSLRAWSTIHLYQHGVFYRIVKIRRQDQLRLQTRQSLVSQQAVAVAIMVISDPTRVPLTYSSSTSEPGVDGIVTNRATGSCSVGFDGSEPNLAWSSETRASFCSRNCGGSEPEASESSAVDGGEEL